MSYASLALGIPKANLPECWGFVLVLTQQSFSLCFLHRVMPFLETELDYETFQASTVPLTHTWAIFSPSSLSK